MWGADVIARRRGQKGAHPHNLSGWWADRSQETGQDFIFNANSLVCKVTSATTHFELQTSPSQCPQNFQPLLAPGKLWTPLPMSSVVNPVGRITAQALSTFQEKGDGV